MTKEEKKFVKVRKHNKDIIDKISRELNISEVTSKVLINRNIKEEKDIEKFLYPSYDHFYDAFLFDTMDSAVNRILQSIENEENIWIYGDYDVDGVTSTSLLVNFFSEIGVEVDYYIPDRHTEGYGLNKEAIKKINQDNGDLIITVDCGITSLDEVDYCNELGMDIIVTDHHTCLEDLPNAVAVLNPNIHNSNYPFKKLAGVGVAFKLVQALSKVLKYELEYSKFLPIVAIGTVADVVSLMDENRLIVKKGLELIKDTSNLGIKALIEVCGLKDKEVTSGHIGFVIGPRINAAGRMSLAKSGVELFTSNDYQEALSIAKELDEKNKKRQEIETKILEEAEEQIYNNVDIESEKVLILSSEDWHHGVIGIVSSRITEKYYRPSVLISIDENGEGRGSARSIPSLNIYDALNEQRDLFINFGGHKQAAGLSIEKENIDILRKNINEWVDKNLDKEDFFEEIEVDCVISSDDIKLKTVKELNMLSPFGMGNPSPLFLFKKAIINNIRGVGKDKKHLKLEINYDGYDIDCIGFNLGYYSEKLDFKNIVDIIGTLDINEYMGTKKVQIVIKDIITSYHNIEILDKYYGSSLEKSINSEIKMPLPEEFNKYDQVKEKENFLISRLKSDKKVKVYISNPKNLRDVIEGIESEGRELIKNTEIYYKGDINYKKNLIIVNPIEKNITNEGYDEIILFDLPFSKEIYYTILAVHKNNLTILCDNSDYNNNKLCLHKWTPSINELRGIYKSFKENSDIFKLNIPSYTSYAIDNNFNISKIKVILSLNIFSQSGLIKYKKIDDDNYYIKIMDINSKVDITDTQLFKSLLEYAN